MLAILIVLAQVDEQLHLQWPAYEEGNNERTSLQYPSFTDRKGIMVNGPTSSHRKYRGHSLIQEGNLENF